MVIIAYMNNRIRSANFVSLLKLLDLTLFILVYYLSNKNYKKKYEINATKKNISIKHKENTIGMIILIHFLDARIPHIYIIASTKTVMLDNPMLIFILANIIPSINTVDGKIASSNPIIETIFTLFLYFS